MAGTQDERQDRRRYQSTLREERASDTRERIVAAARELFATDGFAGTTVARIAERAGVATPTVYAVFGNKSEIMRELVAHLEADADAEQWRCRIDIEPDPFRKLGHYAAWHRSLFAGGRDVLTAALEAGADTAVADFHRHGQHSSQEWIEPIVAALDDAGALAPGLTRREAADRGWLLTRFELYIHSVQQLHWTDAHYQRWLAESLHQQLLAPAGQPTAQTRGGR